MRIFKDFEKEHLEDFLAEQPDPEPILAEPVNPKVSNRITENYIIFMVFEAINIIVLFLNQGYFSKTYKFTRLEKVSE